MLPRMKAPRRVFLVARCFFCISACGNLPVCAFFGLPTRAPRRGISAANSNEVEAEASHTYYERPRQKRRPSTRPRKPRYYWHSIDNMQSELYQFWEGLDVPIREIYPDEPPPLPSEYLLNHFDRNDLRWGIAQMGGRENVAHMLGGARIVPGRWKDAMELEEVRYLLPLMEENDKRPEKSGSNESSKNGSATAQAGEQRSNTQQSPGVAVAEQHDAQTIHVGGNRTDKPLISLVLSDAQHTTSAKRQRKEFWSQEKAIKELYKYLESYRDHKKRPAVFMPQVAELSQEGYSQLFNACSRFKQLPCIDEFTEGEAGEIHSVAGLVPFREWRFFESQLQLFVELQYYLQCHHNGSEEFFPEPLDVLSRGHNQLYDLVRMHGGKILLAQKLNMKFAWDVNQTSSSSESTWGSFSLDFAVQLLRFIRSQYMRFSPPLSSPFISMPSEEDLLRCGHADLAARVVKYGGYESVARRLGLAFFDGRHTLEKEIYRKAKALWRDRHNASAAEKKATRKTKEIPWDEDIVIKELHAYTKVNMTKRSLPPIVFPLFRYFDEDDRGDLRRAISKFGGKEYICEKAGFVTLETWDSLDPETKANLTSLNMSAEDCSPHNGNRVA